MKRLIAIGDIHGCFYTLESLLEKVGWNPDEDTLVFIGDYIDRGKNSMAVVLALIGMQIKHGKEKVVCLRGNHEQMAINAHSKNETDVWFMTAAWKQFKAFLNGQIASRKRFHGLKACLFTMKRKIIFFAMQDFPNRHLKKHCQHRSCGEEAGWKKIAGNGKSRLYLGIRPVKPDLHTQH